MKNYESLAAALSDLKERGYNAEFTAETETVSLYCGELDMRLDPDEFHVDEMYRFDCNSIHNENAILYAISDPVSGVKGVLVDSTHTDQLHHDATSIKHDYITLKKIDMEPIKPHRKGNSEEEMEQEIIEQFSHDANITEGDEFLDDAIRMKDQPLGETTVMTGDE